MILPDSLIAVRRSSAVPAASPGDQAGQQHQRRFHLHGGEMPGQGGGWRRNLVRQQTELNRLHGRPPCTVTSAQPAPRCPRCGRKGPKPAQTGPAGPPPTPASPPRRRCPRPAGTPGQSRPPGSAAWTHPAAPPATPPHHAAACCPAPAVTGPRTDAVAGSSVTAVTVLTAAHRPAAAIRSIPVTSRGSTAAAARRRYSHPGRSPPPADRPAPPRRCSRRSAGPAPHRLL